MTAVFYNLISPFIEFQLLLFIMRFVCSMIDVFLSSGKCFYKFSLVCKTMHIITYPGGASALWSDEGRVGGVSGSWSGCFIQ